MLYSKKYEGIEIVINSRGAEQESLNVNGKEYMRNRDEYWNRKAPILFPIVGSLKDKKTYIDGNLYSMNQHGFARDKEFKLNKETENSLEFILGWDEETLKLWPYKFNLIVKYTIENNKVSVDITIVNVDSDDIFFNVGGHPGFKLPMEDGLKFEDYKIGFEYVEDFDSPCIGEGAMLDFKHWDEYRNIKEIQLDYKYFLIDALVARYIKSRYVTLTHNGKGIKFNYYGFNTIAFWTKPNAPFLCLEPWLGYGDGCDSDYQFKNKADIVRLKVKDEYKVGYSIEILN